MKNIYLNISGKIELSYIKAISEIKIVTEALKIPFFIIGASARDFIFEYCYIYFYSQILLQSISL